MKIGFIGIGIMGLPMVRHLKKTGYPISIYNRTFDKIKHLSEEFEVTNSLEELVKDKDIVFSIVGYPSEVESVLFESFKYAKKKAIFIDMTTSSPKLASRLAREADTLGLTLLDAPVTGGDIGAINGTLSMMVGGDEKAYQSVKPLLETMTKKITYMGSAGSGQYAKLANQICIAGNLMGIAEALSFANDHHLDLDSMLQVISAGSAASWQAINNGPKMIHKDYKPGFYVKHFLKDLSLALEEMVTPLPLLKQAQQIYTYLSESHLDSGTQAIIEYYLMKQ
ncbi:NAD(P)-dependent oxidoreductase [Acholeplasma vituli]|uniref:NAD(P)-dependent oxidoreductase n=2 Tax=Paracholeplasma vituli TaxID=69473 RepID=A0ABT2PXH2_9MOLU|nr:NAD(P)-dependent oxidoreductase [Paracholeplasma vituli]